MQVLVRSGHQMLTHRFYIV